MKFAIRPQGYSINTEILDARMKGQEWLGHKYHRFLKRNDCSIEVLNSLSLVLSTSCFVQAVVRMDVFFSETENSHDNQLTSWPRQTLRAVESATCRRESRDSISGDTRFRGNCQIPKLAPNSGARTISSNHYPSVEDGWKEQVLIQRCFILCGLYSSRSSN